MDQAPLRSFGATATSLSRNPLGIIALFIVLVYGLACLVVITGGTLPLVETIPIVYFMIVFPFVVLAVFTYLVSFKAGQLFGPGDFKTEENYLRLQQMQYTAVASLAVANETRNIDQPGKKDFNIEEVVKSVENAIKLSEQGSENSSVLWVDDNPNNNLYERRAMEAVGVKFILAENTNDALALMSSQSFGAIISDMGRVEGPREGYTLLDAIRLRGDKTPLFFYATSNAPEHKQETYQHGGQGCTNNGQELFKMVTQALFGLRPRSVLKMDRATVA